MEYSIQHSEHDRDGQFYIPSPEGAQHPPLGHMTYIRAGADRATVIIQYTETGEALRGTGAGRKLVLAAVEWARSEQLKIIPLCPFAKSVFMRDPSLHDVLATPLTPGDSF